MTVLELPAAPIREQTWLERATHLRPLPSPLPFLDQPRRERTVVLCHLDPRRPERDARHPRRIIVEGGDPAVEADEFTRDCRTPLGAELVAVQRLGLTHCVGCVLFERHTPGRLPSIEETDELWDAVPGRLSPARAVIT